MIHQPLCTCDECEVDLRIAAALETENRRASDNFAVAELKFTRLREVRLRDQLATVIHFPVERTTGIGGAP